MLKIVNTPVRNLIYAGLIAIFTFIANSFGAAPVAGSGTCLNFDGTDNYVYVTNASDVAVSNKWTLEFWIKPDLFTSIYDVIFIQGYTSNINRQLVAYWYFDRIEFYTTTNGGAGTPYKATTAIPEDGNTWTHIAWTYTDSTNVHTIYVNGESVSGSLSSTITNVGGETYIG